MRRARDGRPAGSAWRRACLWRTGWRSATRGGRKRWSARGRSGSRPHWPTAPLHRRCGQGWGVCGLLAAAAKLLVRRGAVPLPLTCSSASVHAVFACRPSRSFHLLPLPRSNPCAQLVTEPERHLRREYTPLHRRLGEEQKRRSARLAAARVQQVRAVDVAVGWGWEVSRWCKTGARQGRWVGQGCLLGSWCHAAASRCRLPAGPGRGGPHLPAPAEPALPPAGCRAGGARAGWGGGGPAPTQRRRGGLQRRGGAGHASMLHALLCRT